MAGQAGGASEFGVRLALPTVGALPRGRLRVDRRHSGVAGRELQGGICSRYYQSARYILSKQRSLALPLFSFCPQAIASGQLTLVVGPWEGVYHTAKAKNTAHRQAMSRFVLTDDDIVVNIDVDNIMNPGFAEHVAAACKSPATCVQYFAGNRHDGTYGRIATSVGNFLRTRGYDENSEAAGSHDGDLIQRLQWEEACKFRCFSTAAVNGWPLAQAIKNSKRDTIGPDAGPWKEMNRRNEVLFRDRRLQNRAATPPKPLQIL